MRVASQSQIAVITAFPTSFVPKICAGERGPSPMMPILRFLSFFDAIRVLQEQPSRYCGDGSVIS